MHAVIRRYRGASALNDLLAQRSQDVEQLLSDVPGFEAYYAIRDGDELATVTVCQDQAGTQESSRRAAEWVRQNFTSGSVGAPEIIEGEAFIRFGR
jgi:heme-degrading monooxygenase HmoA